VGDRHVMLEMLRREAVLGGEDSGHIIFRESHSTGDGMMAALKLIDAVREAGRPLSHLAGVMEIFPQELVNVDVASKPDLEQVPEVAAVIRDVERRLGGRGRVLVRYSGTQPKCRVMVEGPTVEETRTLCGRIADVIRDVLGA
jgi:phosphoglucosamine mutase